MFSRRMIAKKPLILDPNAEHIIVMRGNGAQGSTTFLNEGTGGDFVSGYGTPIISTGTPRFGTGCISVIQNILVSPQSSKYVLGSKDFTLEFWIRSWAGLGRSSHGMAFVGPAWGFWNEIESPQYRGAGFYLEGSTYYTAANLPCDSLGYGAWNHIAITRAGTSMFLHQNGALKSQITVAAGYLLESASPAVGGIQMGTHYQWTFPAQGLYYTYDYSQYEYDDIHLQINVPKYTPANFTPVILPPFFV
jgi:hypothetical protein